ncbi:MAG: acyl-CoA desaturase [Cyanobacteria bacterium PR.3.49]|jgi:stearoyl-CoA desaturase (delta-9 desaturase)|nr:acyl-CoA desaturase [Cyanobacteria bacterium PR.3.49]
MFEFIAVFAVSYVLHACGITIGYHRLLSHRAFSCPKPVEYFWVFLGLLAFEGSPIWWATIHRAHHRYTDMEKDPHSPRNGLMYSLTGWLAEKEYLPHLDPHKQCKDLLKDPIYRFMECGGNLQASHGLSFAIGFGFRAVLWALFGWKVALASLLAGFAVLTIPLMLNVICHLPAWGYKTYAGDDDSVNVWWVGLLAMGEGWHNNHHAAPGSARTGMLPWEFDLSWLIIQAMHKLKLVTRMNVATHYQLFRASMKRQAAQARAGKAPTHRLYEVGSRKRKRARVKAS